MKELPPHWCSVIKNAAVGAGMSVKAVGGPALLTVYEYKIAADVLLLFETHYGRKKSQGLALILLTFGWARASLRDAN